MKAFAATFDRGVGLSHYTGQVTHHIAPDIDAERKYFVTSLEQAGMADAVYQITGVGLTLNGRNGEGDPYYTDGEISIVRLTANGQKRNGPPEILPSPPLVRLKNDAWKSVRDALGD